MKKQANVIYVLLLRLQRGKNTLSIWITKTRECFENAHKACRMTHKM